MEMDWLIDSNNLRDMEDSSPKISTVGAPEMNSFPTHKHKICHW